MVRKINFKVLPTRWGVLAVDCFIVIISLVFAFQLRFNFNVPLEEQLLILKAVVSLFAIRFICFILFRTYAGMIQYTSSEDAKRIFLSISLGTATLGILNFIVVQFQEYYLIPFSILLIDYFISMFLLAAYRIAVKTIYEEVVKLKKPKVAVIIYGADYNGIITKRTLEQNGNTNYNIVAFIDSDPSLQKKILEGVRVLNIDSELEKLLATGEADMLIISDSTVRQLIKSKVINACLKYEVKVLSVPPASKWINGELSVNQIRQVRIEDLLEREPIKLDKEIIESQTRGKKILVTGAAGSIGQEIVRQLAKYNPSLLICFDQAESPLHELDLELQHDFPNLKFEIVLGDIRVEERLEKVFRILKPELVYHAAAYKHVPLMENNPSESVLTNVLGTKNCADLAVKYGVEVFVLVSTDKAVNPTNVMGASKRISEIYVQSLNRKLFSERGGKATHFITTRFGNVLGSNGSVIPRFRQQIESGGPITVTDPEITRFFMTIPEACQLVLEAGAMGKGGEIFIFDMGEPVKIIDLAKKMIQLSGLQLDKDIKIEITGLRPGEKLYEELLANAENTLSTHHPKILIAKVREYGFDDVCKEVETLISLFNNQDNKAIVSKMKQIVPEYISNNSIYVELDA